MKNNLEITRWWFFCNNLKYYLKWGQWSGQWMTHEWRSKEQKPTHQITGGFSLPNNNNSNNLSSKFNFKMKETAYSAPKLKAEINENQFKHLKSASRELFWTSNIPLVPDRGRILGRDGLTERRNRWGIFIILFSSLSRKLLHLTSAFVSRCKHKYWMCLGCTF